MRGDLASAGDGPATNQTTEKQGLPTATRLRAALVSCDSLMGDCARVASDKEETSAGQMLAAATAAKLAAASALTASAIARLAEADTHQRLAGAKIELSYLPFTMRRRPMRHTPRAEPVRDDWSAYSDDDDADDSDLEKSTNNPGPE